MDESSLTFHMKTCKNRLNVAPFLGLYQAGVTILQVAL